MSHKSSSNLAKITPHVSVKPEYNCLDAQDYVETFQSQVLE